MPGTPATSRTRLTAGQDLGIVDALVQASFLIQELLGGLGAEHDLSITQVRMLGVLRDREPRMTQLAELLGLSKQSATGLIDRAERRGLVQRITVPVGDDRAVHVSLAPEGQELAAVLTAQAELRVAALVAELAADDRRRLSTLLSHLVFGHAEHQGRDLRPTTLKETPR